MAAHWGSSALSPTVGADHLRLLMREVATQNRIVWNFYDQLIGLGMIKRALQRPKEIGIV